MTGFYMEHWTGIGYVCVVENVKSIARLIPEASLSTHNSNFT